MKPESCAVGISMDRTPSARIDLEKVKTVSDVSLGDVVEVRIKGKVTRMSGPSEELWKDEKGKDKKHSYPGTLEIEMDKFEVAAPGDFEEMYE